MLLQEETWTKLSSFIYCYFCFVSLTYLTERCVSNCEDETISSSIVASLPNINRLVLCFIIRFLQVRDVLLVNLSSSLLPSSSYHYFHRLLSFWWMWTSGLITNVPSARSALEHSWLSYSFTSFKRRKSQRVTSVNGPLFSQDILQTWRDTCHKNGRQ